MSFVSYLGPPDGLAVVKPDQLDPSFTLSHESFIKLQRYVLNVMNIRELPDGDLFAEARKLREDAQKHAGKWKNELFPETVNFANEVGNFADLPITSAQVILDAIKQGKSATEIVRVVSSEHLGIILEGASQLVEKSSKLISVRGCLLASLIFSTPSCDRSFCRLRSTSFFTILFASVGTGDPEAEHSWRSKRRSKDSGQVRV
jgi:hypothetical protein